MDSIRGKNSNQTKANLLGRLGLESFDQIQEQLEGAFLVVQVVLDVVGSFAVLLVGRLVHAIQSHKLCKRRDTFSMSEQNKVTGHKYNPSI